MTKGWHPDNLLFNLLFLGQKVSKTPEKVSESRQLTFLQLLDSLCFIYEKVSKVSKVSKFIYIYIYREYTYINGFGAYFFYFAYFFSLTR